MTPLSEWTTEEIMEELKFGHGVPELCGGTDALIAELLRRKERETVDRCVDLIRASASGYREVQSIETSGSGKAVAAGKAGVLEDIANYIRGLQ